MYGCSQIADQCAADFRILLFEPKATPRPAKEFAPLATEFALIKGSRTKRLRKVPRPVYPVTIAQRCRGSSSPATGATASIEGRKRGATFALAACWYA
jgi:hypothetical protein